ncbi:sensor domain-containing diguanylate cyclase [Eubacteriales bacterium OttesenSCG-928-G02]|nr:sensor domain-containing diguanylate cyclase [Eubacteriales bacterium OttesenSCG-928-G02]
MKIIKAIKKFSLIILTASIICIILALSAFDLTGLASGYDTMLNAANSGEINLVTVLYIMLVIILAAAGVITALILVQIRSKKLLKAEMLKKDSWNEVRVETFSDSFNDSIYEYDFINKTFTYNERFKLLFVNKINFKFSDFIDLVHSEDSIAHSELWEKEPHGDFNGCVELRIKSKNSDEYLWYKLRTLSNVDKNGKVVNVIGKLQDINELKTENTSLSIEAKTDALTGICNRGYVQSEIIKTIKLNLESKGTFMIVDINDFKLINDNYGHKNGDIALKFVADTLSMIFRKSDIVGRFGGDEFVVYMRNVVSAEIALRLANRINEEVKNAVKQMPFKIICSIGIAMYPASGETYDELYEKADLALYESKNFKEGKATIYGSDEYTQDKLNRLEALYKYVYIVELETFTALYANENLKKLAPNITIGEKCYKLLSNCSTVCENCPVGNWRDSGKMVFETYLDHKILNKTLNITVSEITWKNTKNAVILAFSD